MYALSDRQSDTENIQEILQIPLHKIPLRFLLMAAFKFPIRLEKKFRSHLLRALKSKSDVWKLSTMVPIFFKSIGII